MGIDDRIDATAKNIEGKAQEMMGEITGDAKDKAEGRAKQAQAEGQHAVENVKDDIKRGIDKV
ncbi:MAG: CsbD family protein [Elainellaceae cyanobacterium]